MIDARGGITLGMKVGGHALILKVVGDLRAQHGAALLALGSETHSFDQNQRYVGLAYRVLPDGRLRIVPPRTAQEAPGGLYQLFLVGKNGRPSKGYMVKLEE